MPLFSVIVVLFYSPLDVTARNLESLERHAGLVEVLLVDNSNDSAYLKQVRQWLDGMSPKIREFTRIQPTGKNLGYAGGNNYGVAHASGKYLVILNPDMELGPQFIDRAKELVQDRAGHILSPKIYVSKSPRVIQSTYTVFNPRSLFYMKYPGQDAIDTGIYDAPRVSAYPPGGCFLITRALFARLGGFDTSFFMYSEDADLGFRARELGEPTRYRPELVAFHYHPKKANSLFAEQLILRNKLLLFGKHCSFPVLMLQLLYAFVQWAIVVSDYRSRKIKTGYILPLFRGVIEGFVLGWKAHLSRGRATRGT